MPRQPIGKRIEDWFKSLPLVGNIAAWLIDWQNRRRETSQQITLALQTAIQEGEWGAIPGILTAALFHQVTGDVPFIGDAIERFAFSKSDDIERFKDDPQGYLEEVFERGFGDPSVRKFTEFVGTIITDPVLNLLEQYASDPSPDPHDMARSFHGIASGLPWASGAIDSVLSLTLGRRAPQPGKHLMSLYWGLGMGFLGWQTLAPLLSSGLQPNLERYYNRLYRPARFSAAQGSDLFALGEWSADKMADYLRDLGWRDEDIQTWIKLSYRSLSEGIVWDLYESGQLTKDQVDRRLRAAGYDPADLPLLYKSHEPEEKQEATRFLLSTVKAAFKDGRMSESEFRSILTEQNYQPQIIDLLVQQLSAQAEEEERQVGEGNIKLLYNQRVIGRDEAQHYLDLLGYSPEIAGKIVDAWDRQALPKPARINKSTILEGYTDGVLGRDEAKGLLQSEAGYSSEQAELIIKIEEAGRPEATPEVGVQAATIAMISDWVRNGLITRAEVEDRAELERFSPEDRERIIDLMFSAEPTVVEPVELPVTILEDAYVFGALSRGELLARLLARGLVEEDAELQIRTLELAYPQVFGETPTLLLRQPSVSSIQLALQRGLIDEAGFRARLEAQGYTLDAIEIFLFNAQYQLPAEPKRPTKADLTHWLAQGIIGRAEFIRRMTEAGYLSVDIDLYLQEESPALQDTQIADLFVNGFLQPSGFVSLATDLGYTPEDIEEFLAQFEQGG